MLALPAGVAPAAVAYGLALVLVICSIALVLMLRRRRSPLRRLLDRQLAPARGFDARTTGSRAVVEMRDR